MKRWRASIGILDVRIAKGYIARWNPALFEIAMLPVEQIRLHSPLSTHHYFLAAATRIASNPVTASALVQNPTFPALLILVSSASSSSLPLR